MKSAGTGSSEHHHRKVLKIRIITDYDDMYERIPNGDEVKSRTEKEMQMTTDLLAGAGVEEPKLLGIRSGILLKTYLILCIVMNIFTMVAVGNGRLKFFYLIKTFFMSFGFYTLSDPKHFKSNMIFTALFGASVLMESVPCVAGILVLFSRDVCSVLAGISNGSSNHNSNMRESEEFLRFCKRNIESVRGIGTAVIVSEILMDSLVFLQLVQYQRYLRTVQSERTALNYYNGKERIAIP